MTKQALIKKELDRLVRLFSLLPKNELDFIRPQLENAAFMKVTLDGLQDAINEGGATDTYQNGANQHGQKASADLQAYNQTIKNYNVLMDKLMAKLPKEQAESRLAEMMADGG